MTKLICNFCDQPITHIVAKFRHEVSTANFMIGLLPNREEMCDVCYTKAKSDPPSKEEVDKSNVKRIADAEKMREDLMKI